jgi:hypothetical protein
MVVFGAGLSGRDFAYRIFPLRHGRATDPAIQFCFKAAAPDLDHRVSQLRCGPVMTEKNQIEAAGGITLPAFFVPDSRVLGTTICEFACNHPVSPTKTRGRSRQARP